MDKVHDRTGLRWCVARTTDDASFMPTMIEPRQERSLESTRRLLDAAAELVAERGYGDATLAAIGQRAGFSRGLVTTRFGSKEGLMWALVKRTTEPWMAHLTDPPSDGTGLDKLCLLVQAIRDHGISHPLDLRVLQQLIIEAAASMPSLQERFEQSLAAMRRYTAELFRQGVADRSIRADVDPLLEADLLVAALRGISYQWFLYPEHVDLSRLHDGLLAQMVRHLAP